MSAAADLLSTAAWETQPFPDQGKRNSLWSVGENVAIAAVLMSMMLLPLLDPLLRWIFGSAAQSTGSIVQHLVLVVGMLGGAIAAREQRLQAILDSARRRGSRAAIAPPNIPTTRTKCWTIEPVLCAAEPKIHRSEGSRSGNNIIDISTAAIAIFSPTDQREFLLPWSGKDCVSHAAVLNKSAAALIDSPLTS